MSIDSLVARRSSIITDLGKAALNIQFPNEFELYMVALELQGGDGSTLQYFIFPVMPYSIDESKPKSTNIKKTAQGVVVLGNSTFTPSDITLSGTFGRRFRVLLGNSFEDLASSFTTSSGGVSAKSIATGVGKNLLNTFSKDIKTGYGCLKVLESMIDQLDEIDENGPKKLILYNLALGNNYLVEPLALRFSQSQESNMIWNYQLTLKSIMPLENFMTSSELEKERARLTFQGILQTGLDTTINNLTRLLNQNTLATTTPSTIDRGNSRKEFITRLSK